MGIATASSSLNHNYETVTADCGHDTTDAVTIPCSPVQATACADGTDCYGDHMRSCRCGH
jgi:hypothetical protein